MLSSRKLWLTQSKFKFIPTQTNAERAIFNIHLQFKWIHISNEHRCTMFLFWQYKRIFVILYLKLSCFVLVCEYVICEIMSAYILISNRFSSKSSRKWEAHKTHNEKIRNKKNVLHNWFERINLKNKYDFAMQTNINRHQWLDAIIFYFTWFMRVLVKVFSSYTWCWCVRADAANDACLYIANSFTPPFEKGMSIKLFAFRLVNLCRYLPNSGNVLIANNSNIYKILSDSSINRILRVIYLYGNFRMMVH